MTRTVDTFMDFTFLKLIVHINLLLCFEWLSSVEGLCSSVTVLVVLLHLKVTNVCYVQLSSVIYRYQFLRCRILKALLSGNNPPPRKSVYQIWAKEVAPLGRGIRWTSVNRNWYEMFNCGSKLNVLGTRDKYIPWYNAAVKARWRSTIYRVLNGGHKPQLLVSYISGCISVS